MSTHGSQVSSPIVGKKHPDLFRKAKAARGAPANAAPAWAVALASAASLTAALLAAADFSPFHSFANAVQGVVAVPMERAPLPLSPRRRPLWLRAQIFQNAPYCPLAATGSAAAQLAPR